jgi:hypothetical protein
LAVSRSQFPPVYAFVYSSFNPRALERDPRHRYATDSEMAWELEHQEQAGVDNSEGRPVLRGWRLPGARKMLRYAGLALVLVVLFGLMLLLARRRSECLSKMLNKRINLWTEKTR